MKELIATWFTSLLVFFQLNPVGSAVVQSDDFGQVEIFRHASTEKQSFVFVIRDEFNDAAAFSRLARQIAKENVTLVGVDLKEARFKFDSIEGRSNFGTKLLRLAEAVEKSLGESTFLAPEVIFINDRRALSLDLRFSSVAEQSGQVETLGVCPGTEVPINGLEDNSGRMVEDHFVEAFVPRDEACDREVEIKRSIQVHVVANRNFDPYSFVTWPREVSERLRINYRAAQPVKSTSLSGGSPEEIFPVVALAPAQLHSSHFVLLLSGDGGWSDFTQDLASEYILRGVPVVGLNSQIYFWKERTPAELTHDIQQIADYYLNFYHVKSYDLVGYSFGGSVVPVIVAHMSQKAKRSMHSAIMLAPGLTSKLQFEVGDWLTNADSGRPIQDDLKNSRGTRFKCLQGIKDAPSVCMNFNSAYGQAFILGGGHHFGYDFKQFEGILF